MNADFFRGSALRLSQDDETKYLASFLYQAADKIDEMEKENKELKQKIEDLEQEIHDIYYDMNYDGGVI